MVRPNAMTDTPSYTTPRKSKRSQYDVFHNSPKGHTGLSFTPIGIGPATSDSFHQWGTKGSQRCDLRLSNADIYSCAHCTLIGSKVWRQLWPFRPNSPHNTDTSTHTSSLLHSLWLSCSLSLGLTALLEHACIIHLATSRMWGLVKKWTHRSGERWEAGIRGGGWG